MKQWLLIILSIGICLPAIAISPTEQALQDSLIDQLQIDEVTVIARAPEKEVIQPQTLRAEELENANALNVADALRYFSGVQLKDYGGVAGIKTINIRSMGSEHVGVYFNGIQLGNAQNGQVDLGRFALSEMKEIQLYHGQKSDIFQSAREMGNSGTIYLVSRRPYFKTGEKVHARALIRGGSFALVNALASVDVRLTDLLSMNLNAEYVHADGRYKFRYRRLTPSGEVAYDTTAVRENGDVEALRAEMSLHHYYRNTGFWRVHGYYYQSERGIPGAIVNNVWNNGERLRDRNAFVQMQWQDCLFDKWHLRFSAKYANDYTHYENLDTRLLPSSNYYTQQEVYASLTQMVNLFRWWDISLAYDIQYNRLDRKELIQSYRPECFIRISHYISLASAWNIKDHLRIQASVLMTHIDSVTRWTPAVFTSYQPVKSIDLKINAFYKQSYRFPTFNDLYYTDAGNANLQPELAQQIDVGIQYAPIPSLHLRADYYHNRVTNKIIAYPKGQQFRWTMLNLGKVIVNGVDVQADYRLQLPYRWQLPIRLQYTYQQSIDVTSANDSYYQHQIPYIPRHSGSVIIGLNWQSKQGHRYGMNYSFIYVGERWSQQENILYNYVQPWYTHDVTLYGEWLIQGHRLKAQCEVNNLLGQDYEIIRNYPMPKQNMRLSITCYY